MCDFVAYGIYLSKKLDIFSFHVIYLKDNVGLADTNPSIDSPNLDLIRGG